MCQLGLCSGESGALPQYNITLKLGKFSQFHNQWWLSGGSRGGKGGASVPPFGLYLTLRSTDDELNETPFSGYRTKKTPTMAHLRMLQKKIRSKTD